MIPKINIVYSGVYDGLFYEHERQDFTEESRKTGGKYAKKLQKSWDKIAKKVLPAMQGVSGLKWKKKELDAYVVRYSGYSFSMPLTLLMKKDIRHANEVIAHELIHNLIVQNKDRIRYKNKIIKKHKPVFKTETHVLLYAILKLTLERAFGKRAKGYLDYELLIFNRNKEYRKAWDIVMEEGAERVIDTFIK
jgi:hypothetical protein